MADIDENLLTSAKLFEQLNGDLDGGADLHRHAGLIEDPEHRGNLSFAREIDGVPDSLLGEVTKTLATDLAADAIQAGNFGQVSHLVGVTESETAGNALTLAARLNEELQNGGAPAFIAGVGNPNTGKTNLAVLLYQLRKAILDEDLKLVSNVRTLDPDHLTTSAHDLACVLLEHRDENTFVLLDEGSTHFDARTYSREVAQQFTPLAKRFAKIGVDSFCTIGHTGKDLHPEVKRLVTLAFNKTEKDVVTFFESWHAESDAPTDKLFGGPIEDLEPASLQYDPDDAAPWNWDLEPELFTLDLDWPELLTELRNRGPADTS